MIFLGRYPVVGKVEISRWSEIRSVSPAWRSTVDGGSIGARPSGRTDKA